MPQVFPRPLFNAGRWSHRLSKFPEGAIIETDGCRAREILPLGYETPPKKLPTSLPAGPTTAKEVKPSNKRLLAGCHYSPHGGGCCGRGHLYGFSNVPTLAQIASLKGQTTPRRCVEVTLTYNQMSTKGWNGYTWDAILKELGWKCVMKFNNGNSGNDVFVYLFSTTERPMT